ncbi:MAG: DeoR/GlpR family DNA-binding transcription regulator [Acetivibrionales bacterium]|jgi:DeoR/GlpR family transcriptional regulator of sugar metabolism
MKKERQNEILKLVMREQKVELTKLVEQFGVSIETIRRDINDLVQTGQIKKVYGGIQHVSEHTSVIDVEHWDKRMEFHSTEKAMIANCVLNLIPDRSTILLDAGTTTHYLAKLLHIKKDLTIFTYSIITASKLLRCCNHAIYVIGGKLRRVEQVTTGTFVNSFLDNIANIDLFISTADGITLENGVTDFYEDVADIKRRFVAKSNSTIVVADNSKFGRITPFMTCRIENIKQLVTDPGTPQYYINGLRSAGVEVLLAE